MLKINVVLVSILLLAILTGCSSHMVYTKKYNEACSPNCFDSKDVNKITKTNSGILYYLPEDILQFNFTREISDTSKIIKKIAAITPKIETANNEKTTNQVKLKNTILLLATEKNEANKKVLEIKKVNFEIAVKYAEVNIKKLTLTLEQLKDQLIIAKQSKYIDTIEIKKLKTAPDTSLPFIAELSHSGRRDDNFNIKTNDKGLLDSFKGDSEDQTDTLIIESVSAITGLLKLPTTFRFSASSSVPSDLTKEIIFSFKYTKNFKPNDKNVLNDIKNDLKNRHALYVIKSEPIKKFAECDSSDKWPGLLYRRPVEYNIEVTSSMSSNQPNFSKSFSFYLLNDGPIASITLPASPFVKTEYDIDFQEGMLISVNSIRPSESLEIVRTIPQMLKAIVDIPAQLIQLKIDYSSKDKALIDAQKELLNAQLELLKADKSLSDYQEEAAE